MRVEPPRHREKRVETGGLEEVFVYELVDISPLEGALEEQAPHARRVKKDGDGRVLVACSWRPRRLRTVVGVATALTCAGASSAMLVRFGLGFLWASAPAHRHHVEPMQQVLAPANGTESALAVPARGMVLVQPAPPSTVQAPREPPAAAVTDATDPGDRECDPSRGPCSPSAALGVAIAGPEGESEQGIQVPTLGGSTSLRLWPSAVADDWGEDADAVNVSSLRLNESGSEGEAEDTVEEDLYSNSSSSSMTTTPPPTMAMASLRAMAPTTLAERNPGVAAVNRSLGSPTLYCFSVMVAAGTERWLLEVQLKQGTGIFGCNEYSVFSDEPLELQSETQGPFLTTAVVGEEAWQGPVPGTSNLVWHNTAMFIEAWQRIRQDGTHTRSDWTVKSDPDCVFLPGVLQRKLAEWYWLTPQTPAYLLNCGRWRSMQGPLEVFSQAAASMLFQGIELCRGALKWQAWGEDWFAEHCLMELGVLGSAGYDLLDDMWCNSDYGDTGHTYLDEYREHGPICDDGKAAFHPYKTTEEFSACLKQALG